MCSEKEIYHLIDIGALTVRNIDLPRKVRLRQTPKRKTEQVRKQNPYGFNFDKVSEEDIIRGAVESNVSVFLHGISTPPSTIGNPSCFRKAFVTEIGRASCRERG